MRESWWGYLEMKYLFESKTECEPLTQTVRDETVTAKGKSLCTIFILIITMQRYAF